MSKDPLEYLRNIQDECSYIISVSQDLSFNDFIEDETLKRAVFSDKMMGFRTDL